MNVEIAVQRIVGQGLCTLFDLGVIVDVLFEVEVVLLRVRRLGEELAVDRLDDLPQGGLYGGEQVVGRVAAQVFDAGLIQAQRVPQLGGGRSDRYVDVAARGEPMHRQPGNHALCHGFIGWAGEGLLHSLSQDLRHLHDGADAGVGAQHAVGRDGLPKLVIADQSWAITGNHVIQDDLDLVAQGDQCAALLSEDQPFEGTNVLGVNGEQPHVLVHALVHRAVELGELGEVGPNLVLLVSGLLQQPFGDYEADVLPGQ